ncbi:angiopoietin-related protein 4 [Ambystoma mexicanum]|uniref:angiopoietin-related protein 4 n=1 Tax=Ambystoma mexicanum TaxID=8296 RepID=UPI0037E85597
MLCSPTALLALCAALLAGGARGFVSERKSAQAKDRKVQLASWDEVNVIAHGLLQLGHGLKEHVDRTKVQLREMSGRMGAHNLSLAELGRSARKVDGEAEALRRRVQELEGRQRQLANASRSQEGALHALSRGAASMDGRVESIEERLQHLERPGAAGSEGAGALGAVQALMDAQNQRIDELLEKLKLQQYKLDKQNLQIKSLQRKIQDNKTQSPKWRPVQTERDTSGGQNASSAQAERNFPSDCQQAFLEGARASGPFRIQPRGSAPILVFCEITPERGWTVVQRRSDGAEDFDRLWEDYRSGFGNLTGDFWLGLENLFAITQQGSYILHIDLQDWEESMQSIEMLFSLGGQDTSYELKIQGLVSGDLENAIGDTRPLPFSTRDHDQDLKSDLNCAKHLSGGWWFSSCGPANLNGKYFRSIPRQRHERKQGIFWKTWKGRYYPLKSAIMKIRPIEVEA